MYNTFACCFASAWGAHVLVVVLLLLLLLLLFLLYNSTIHSSIWINMQQQLYGPNVHGKTSHFYSPKHKPSGSFQCGLIIDGNATTAAAPPSLLEIRTQPDTCKQDLLFIKRSKIHWPLKLRRAYAGGVRGREWERFSVRLASLVFRRGV